MWYAILAILMLLVGFLIGAGPSAPTGTRRPGE
jgi:hypothetical protein